MIVFDLDGTLVDSVPDLAFAVNQALGKMGLPTRQETQIRNWIGNGVDRLVKRAITNSLDQEPDPMLF